MHASDISKVYKLEVLCQPYPWPRSFFRSQLRHGASCWVLEKGSELVGFGIVVIEKESAHILNMCVRPQYRQRGLGHRILLQLLDSTRKKKARYAWLEVRRTNFTAIRLYHRLGFRQKQIFRHYYPMRRGREDGVIMVADLTKNYRNG